MHCQAVEYGKEGLDGRGPHWDIWVQEGQQSRGPTEATCTTAHVRWNGHPSGKHQSARSRHDEGGQLTFCYAHVNRNSTAESGTKASGIAEVRLNCLGEEAKHMDAAPGSARAT